MKKYNSIHFDMDGVLANTEPLHVAAEQQTCRDYNFAISPDQWDGFKGQTANDIFGYLLNNYGDPQTQTVNELIDYKTGLFLQMAQEGLEPIDGAMDFLRWARGNYEKVTLVTSSNRRVQECIIGRFGIRGMFDNIVTGDDIINGKPHPEPYLRSLKQSDTRAETALVIEDSKSGIKSALAAKCAVLAIATSHPADELMEVNPTYVASDYLHARRLLS
jgi:HAD superfamily hydrolase (TIGR01509 family)